MEAVAFPTEDDFRLTYSMADQHHVDVATNSSPSEHILVFYLSTP